MFEINPHLSANAFIIGKEKTPIVVVDDFMLDYSAAIAEARVAQYSSDKGDVGAYYPGIRSPVNREYGMMVVKYTASLLCKLHKLPTTTKISPINANYSLITKHPHEMSSTQCLPHYDTGEPNTFAMLHYLNPGRFGGTSFYRHRPTQFENVSLHRQDTYLDSMQHFIKQHGEPSRQYFTESDPHYELIYKVDYRPNRLVIYPTSLLHTAYIDDPSHDVNDDPKTGRLSTNFLLKLIA